MPQPLKFFFEEGDGEDVEQATSRNDLLAFATRR